MTTIPITAVQAELLYLFVFEDAWQDVHATLRFDDRAVDVRDSNQFFSLLADTANDLADNEGDHVAANVLRRVASKVLRAKSEVTQ